MQYKNIVPAQDWFFCHDGLNPNDPQIIYPVAVWASYERYDENGDGPNTVVIGLIAPDFGSFGGDAVSRLHSPPPVKGRYLHRCELSADDLARLMRS